VGGENLTLVLHFIGYLINKPKHCLLHCSYLLVVTLNSFIAKLVLHLFSFCFTFSLQYCAILDSAIETPTLMIWGEDDMALTKESTYRTDEFVRDFRIRYLPRISHWVQQDAPDETNAMIRAFLCDEPIPYMAWEARLVDEEPQDPSTSSG